MLLDQDTIEKKTRHLDAVLARPELVRRAVARRLPDPFTLEEVPRCWEPGGGSTLFRIQSPRGRFHLKVKHREVKTELRLECEADFARRSPLENEHHFYSTLEVEWVPRVLFFEREGEFDLLAVEWLDAFGAGVERLTVEQLLRAFTMIRDQVRELYRRGVVHLDLHEQNLRFRGPDPVLCDFEEARYLKQEVPFEDSLDFSGQNRYGTLCDFLPGQGLGGRTCLARLERVFRDQVLRRLPKLIEECIFDDRCPFNRDQLQEPDSRIYQSLDLPRIKVQGQRPERDERVLLLRYFIWKLSRERRPIRHLDLGSNLGVFCFQAASSASVETSVGLEAFEKYADVARFLSFAYGSRKTVFHRFECGKDHLADKLDRADIVTMLSVYHHIANREHLLDEIRKLAPRYLLAELATQERYYPARGNLAREIAHIRQRAGFRFSDVLAHTIDYQRPMVLFSNEGASPMDRWAARIIFSRRKALRRAMSVISNRFASLRFGDREASRG
jgi:methyltransferase family protein